MSLPSEFKITAAGTPIKSVIVGSDADGGNYGSATDGLDAERIREALETLTPISNKPKA